MSWVAGIDLSSHAIDVVLVDENDVLPPVWHRTPLAGPDAFTRTRQLRERYLLYRDCWDDVLAVGIEDPAGRHGVRAVARVQGAVLTHIPLEILVTPWQPAQWRKAVGLPGNASKQDVAAWALKQPDAHVWQPGTPFDALDAYTIARATRVVLERGQAAA